jgi:hypothetical protein
MNVDEALANCEFLWNLQSGDTGRRRVEHRSYFQLWFTNHQLLDIGQKDFVLVPINIPK